MNHFAIPANERKRMDQF